MIKNRFNFFLIFSVLIHTILFYSLKVNMNFNKQLYNHKLYSLDILTVSKKNQVAQHHVETEKISKNIHIEKQPLKKIERVKPKPFISNKITDIPDKDNIPIKKVNDVKKQSINKDISNSMKPTEGYTHIITKTNVLRNVESKFNEVATQENVAESKDIEPAFDIKSYSKYILSKIKERLEYPFLARRRGIEGDVEVMITISQIGRLEKLEILKSSGYEILDKNTLDLQGKITFEQLPPETVSFPLKISYRLQ